VTDQKKSPNLSSLFMESLKIFEKGCPHPTISNTNQNQNLSQKDRSLKIVEKRDFSRDEDQEEEKDAEESKEQEDTKDEDLNALDLILRKLDSVPTKEDLSKLKDSVKTEILRDVNKLLVRKEDEAQKLENQTSAKGRSKKANSTKKKKEEPDYDDSGSFIMFSYYIYLFFR